MFEMLLAGFALAASLGLLVRLGLGRRRRARADAALVRVWRAAHRTALAAYRWPGSRRRAVRIANEAIGKARGQQPEVGTVIRPKSFRERRKLH